MRRALLLLLAAAAPAGAQGPVNLRLRLDVGDSFTQRTTAVQNIEQTVMGATQAIKQTIGITTRYDVDAATDSVYGIRAVYTAVRYLMDGPMGATRYDSDDAASKPDAATAAYAALVGQRFTFTVDPLGRVLAVEGTEAMLAAVSDALDVADEAQRAAVRKSLEAQFGGEALRGQIENSLAVYPDGPVSVGDAWTREVTVRAGMPLTLTNTYRLEALEAGVPVLAVESTVTSAAGPPMDMGGAKIAFDLNGTQSGRLRLHPARGTVEEGTLAQTLAGEATVNGAMTLPMSISSVNTTETLD